MEHNEFILLIYTICNINTIFVSKKNSARALLKAVFSIEIIKDGK